VKTKIKILIWGMAVCSNVEAAIIHIPDSYLTIQGGINAAVDGDTVLVHPGIYNETIVFHGKKILVTSRYFNTGDRQWIDETVIKADSAGSVVYFLDYEDSSSVLNGFTITNGHPDWYVPRNRGGGIFCGKYAYPKLMNLVIRDNMAYHGGGIYCYVWSHPEITNVTAKNNLATIGGGIYLEYDTSPTLNNVDVYDNRAVDAGGGIYCYSQSHPLIKNTTIYNNYTPMRGGGIFLHACYPRLINVTLYGNVAGRGGAVYLGFFAELKIVNSILWNNLPEEISFSDLFGGESSLMVAYCDVRGGESGILNYRDEIFWMEGNIETNPFFQNPENGDFRLKSNSSPCVNTGIAFFEWEDDTLVNLETTEYNNSAPDMGAFESPQIVSVENQRTFFNDFILYQNYPNPFNATTEISYFLPWFSSVHLNFYNELGQIITTSNSENKPPGLHHFVWQAENYPSGIYFYQVETEKYSEIGKCLLLK